MKNFPHQFSDIIRLSRGLAVFIDLSEHDRDVNNDEVVGIALARAGVYTFRNQNLSLAAAIRSELQKPRAQRGSHTAARDLRRFFTLLGFIDRQYEPSDVGRDLVNATVNNDEERVKSIWKSALNGMVLADDHDNLSHPYPILIKLVGQRPGINKKYLALCLEALNDSDEEFARLIDIIDQDDFENSMHLLGISGASAANAVKILPAIAKQLGDITQEGENCFPDIDINEIESLAVEAVRQITFSRRSPARRHRAVSVEQIAGIDQTGQVPPAREPELYLAGIMAGIELRRERTLQHQLLVQEFARRCANAGFDLMEDPFDCLATSANTVLLAEMKTLDSSRVDEREQVQQALAQLQYYRYFDLPENVNRQQTILIAVFDREISQEHSDFFQAQDIYVAWKANDTFSGTPNSISFLQQAGIIQ